MPPTCWWPTITCTTNSTGSGALQALRAVCGPHTPALLVTADGSDTLKRTARDLGIPVLTKPVKPASLRAFLAAQRRRGGG